MKSLDTYFLNPFESPHISLDRLKNGTHDHLQRLTAQNSSGQYNVEIEALTTAYENYFGQLTGAGNTGALRQARTLAVDQHLAVFSKRVSQLNAYLISQGLKDAPVYMEFFPSGVTVFTESLRKENAGQLMQRLVDAISANTDVAGGPATLTQFQGFLAAFNLLRGQQLGKKGEEEGKKTSRDAARKVLTDQLFTNLQTIALKYPGQPEKVGDFFDEVAFTGVQSATAGKARIRFIVKDVKNNPVEGATIKVRDAGINETVTNRDGKAVSQYMAAGTYTVHTSAEGFPAATMVVNASKGKTEEAFIVLQ